MQFTECIWFINSSYTSGCLRSLFHLNHPLSQHLPLYRSITAKSTRLPHHSQLKYHTTTPARRRPRTKRPSAHDVPGLAALAHGGVLGPRRWWWWCDGTFGEATEARAGPCFVSNVDDRKSRPVTAKWVYSTEEFKGVRTAYRERWGVRFSVAASRVCGVAVSVAWGGVIRTP